jgi:hypothetical protein
MPSPFPGMDPYIERPAIWPDFHDALVTAIRGFLQPLLKPRYVALMQDRWFVVESDRPIRPDVAVIRTNELNRPKSSQGSAAVLDVDEPAVFEIWREDVKQPLIEIIEPAEGNRVVTAIEVLSPDNKTPGKGRDNYLQKRDEYWQEGANLVEIDLLRGGRSTVLLSDEQRASLAPHRYLVTVTRRWPSRHEAYPIPLSQRLPKVAIPLAYGDKDVSLELQAAMNRCWDEGPYPELLRYADGPPSDLSNEEQAWCRERLQAANSR